MIEQELDDFKLPVVGRVVKWRTEFVRGLESEIMVVRRYFIHVGAFVEEVLNKITSPSSAGDVERERSFYRSSVRDHGAIYVD